MIRQRASVSVAMFVMAFFIVAAGCGKEAGIRLKIVANGVSVPADLDSLRVTYKYYGAGSQAWEREHYDIAGLPQTIVIYKGYRYDEGVKVWVDGFKEGHWTIAAFTDTKFPPNGIKEVIVTLSADCIDRCLSPTTHCEAGECRPSESSSFSGEDADADGEDAPGDDVSIDDTVFEDVPPEDLIIDDPFADDPIIDDIPIDGTVCGNGVIEAGEDCDPPGQREICTGPTIPYGKRTCSDLCLWTECELIPAKILFTTNRDGDWEIYSMDPDGSRQVNLSNDHTHLDSYERWSHDGTRIAFVKCSSCGWNETHDIYIMNSDGSDPQSIWSYSYDIHGITWSADDRWIYFAQTTGSCRTSFYQVRPDGTNGGQYYNPGGQVEGPDIFQDGLWLVYSRESGCSSGSNEIYKTPLATPGMPVINLTSLAGCNQSPRWSLDGNDITWVFESGICLGSGYDIYRMSSDGTGRTRLTNNSILDTTPVFGYGDSKILFTSLSDGDDEIYVMDMDGTITGKLTDNSAHDVMSDWWEARELEWVPIPPGTFTMGSPLGELGRGADEVQHTVTLTIPFEIMVHEVTQGGFKDLMSYNPSHFSSCGLNCPVEMVSWHEALAYANAYSRAKGVPECFDCTGTAPDFSCSLKPAYSKPQDCPGYRLPTEAEWEYTSRAGTTTAIFNGDLIHTGCEVDPKLNAAGWYCGNAAGITHPVKMKMTSPWGLYDMIGNVAEWVWDWYATYPGNETDPWGPATDSNRVARGNRYNNNAEDCRSALRSYGPPGYRADGLGFRLVRSYCGGSSYSWSQKSPGDSPSPREDPEMAYHASNERMILFGGATGSGVWSAETWIWDGVTWSSFTGDPHPDARYRVSMAFDSHRQKTVLFGGCSSGTSGCGGQRQDTWEWNGSVWEDKTPASGNPQGRHSAAMAFDEARGVIVLFGGCLDGQCEGSTASNETWEWNGISWTPVSFIDHPQAGGYASMAYDSNRRVIVYYGGCNGSTCYTDTYEYDGIFWQKIATLHTPGSLANSRMVFDPCMNKIFLYAGSRAGEGPLNEVWEYDGSDWQLLDTSGALPARYSAAVNFDADNNALILFGGVDGTNMYGDTWVLEH
jgi:formylglycine-generating enzyme required for sulfatase activity